MSGGDVHAEVILVFQGGEEGGQDFQEAPGVVAGDEVSSPLHGCAAAVGDHRLHSLKDLLGEDVGVGSADNQGGALQGLKAAPEGIGGPAFGAEVGASYGGVVLPRPLAVGGFADGVLEAAVDQPGGTSGIVHDALDELFVAVEPVWEGDEVADASTSGGDLSGAGVDDDEAAHKVRSSGGEDVAVASTHGMADDDEVLQAEGFGDGVKVSLVGVEGVVGVGGPLAIAVSAGIEGDDVVAVGEGEGDEIPAVGLLADAVEHEQGGTVGAAPLQVVESEAADFDFAVLRGRFRLEGNVEASGGFVEGEALRLVLMSWSVLHWGASP